MARCKDVSARNAKSGINWGSSNSKIGLFLMVMNSWIASFNSAILLNTLARLS